MRVLLTIDTDGDFVVEEEHCIRKFLRKTGFEAIYLEFDLDMIGVVIDCIATDTKGTRVEHVGKRLRLEKDKIIKELKEDSFVAIDLGNQYVEIKIFKADDLINKGGPMNERFLEK